MNLRAKILAATLKTAKVDAPELADEPITIKAMSGKQRDAFEAAVVGKKVVGGLRARALIDYAVDENGNKIFNDRDLEAVNELPAAGLDKVLDAVLELNGLTAAQVDELEGN